MDWIPEVPTGIVFLVILIINWLQDARVRRLESRLTAHERKPHQIDPFTVPPGKYRPYEDFEKMERGG